MRMFKIILADEGSAFEFIANEQNIPKMFDPQDASIIRELIRSMIRGCSVIEQRINGIDYIVEEIKSCKLKRGSLDAFI